MKRNFVGQFRLSAIPDDRYSLCRPIAEPQPSLPSISADRYSQSFQPPLARFSILCNSNLHPFNHIVFRCFPLAKFPLIVQNYSLLFDREKGSRSDIFFYEEKFYIFIRKLFRFVLIVGIDD